MNARDVDQLMRSLSSRQHGVVGRDQLREQGVSRQAVGFRLRSTDWEVLTPRVLRLVGAPVTDRQRAMAAVLDAGGGAVVSHGSAAALWELPGFDLRRIHVSRARSATSRPTTLAAVHHPRALPEHHRSVCHRIPVTTLARTVVDLAATAHPARVELALHAAVRVGLAWTVAHDVVRELSARGRTGVGVARRLVAAGAGTRPLGSGLEGRLLRILAGAGIPEPRRQVDVGGAEWAGRVDFYYEDVGLVIEVDGAWHHEGALDVRRDKRRLAALAAAGFRVLPISEELIRRSPDRVTQLVREARRRPPDASGPQNDVILASVRGPERGAASGRAS